MNDSEREDYAIQTSLLRIELEVMLNKTKKIEEILRKEIQVDTCSNTDFYSPDKGVKEQEPPKKRMKTKY